MKNKNFLKNFAFFFLFLILTNYSISSKKSNSYSFGKPNKEILKMTKKLFNFHNTTNLTKINNLNNLTLSINDMDIKIFCKNHCNFQGYCLEGICFCKPGFSGDDCGTVLNPSDVTCLNNCNNNGICDELGRCICHDGYSGLDCSISK
jgi:hypothetical protein